MLGLLLLDADIPAAVSDTPPPEWAEAWLAKRRGREEKKARSASSPADEPIAVDEKSQRRADKRDERMREGVARLAMWLADLVRSGLAGIETRPASFWTEPAKRLVRRAGAASRPRSSVWRRFQAWDLSGRSDCSESVAG